MWFLYGLSMYLFVLGIRISGTWNAKSRHWIKGRKNWKNTFKTFELKTSPRIWFHVSSLGEFEQARPVIETIISQRPDVQIFLSFFSPSGYIPNQAYSKAIVVYLPPDLPGNAAYFLKYIQPDIAVFVKYDLWPGYLRELNRQHIPAILLSAHWTAGSGFSSWSAPLTSHYLKSFKKIFQQREYDRVYFEKSGFENLVVSGDTRIDRSLELAGELSRIPETLKALSFDIVAGSTWGPDEKLLIPVIKKLKLKAIIAPHDVSKGNLKRMSSLIEDNYQLLSDLGTDLFHADILIIDNIGLLSVLYEKGRIAYVGGGFGKGIHNILEPAAHARPIIFGPRFNKFPEAGDLISIKAAYAVNNISKLEAIFKDLLQPGKAEEAGANALKYLEDYAGATKTVSGYILESIPYTVKE